MRTVTVIDNQIVVEVDGAKVKYPLEIVRKRINSLLQDLKTWREYERLLTQLAVDEIICACSHDVYENVVNPGNCMACGKPFRH